MIAAASGPASYMQKRTAGVPCLYDLDERFRVMDRFEGYVQVLTLSSPPVEALGEPALTRDLARLANDEMADLVRRHPDRFLGFAASLPMNDPDAAVREADRAIADLGALGVQIYEREWPAPGRSALRAALRAHGRARPHDVGPSRTHRGDAGLPGGG